MTLLAQAPEDQAKETFTWQTDVMVSDNGTEQRVDNCTLPQRLLEELLIFDSIADVRAQVFAMMAFGGSFDRPLFVYSTPLTANEALGAMSLTFDARRTEIRSGGKGYIYDQNGGEVVNINTLSSGGATLFTGLSRAYAAGAWLCPVTTAVSGTNAVLGRLNPDYAAQASLTLRDIKFLSPFVNPYNTQTLTELAGLPILDRRPVGTQFDEGFDTGIELFDSGGAVDVRNPWKHAQLTFQRSFLVHRVNNPDDWDWWRVFADYTKGSCNPFYMPSWHQDFPLVTAPAPGGVTLTFGGTNYATSFFPYGAFKAVAITTLAGTHYATVSAAVSAGGNSNVTFAPALPVGAGWETVLEVSMLLKSRIADDNVVCYHGQLDSQVQLNLRTVDA